MIYKKDFTVVGIISFDRRGILKEINEIGDWDQKSTLYVYQRDGKYYACFLSWCKSLESAMLITILITLHAYIAVRL